MRFARYPAALREKAPAPARVVSFPAGSANLVLVATCALAFASACRGGKAPSSAETATVRGRVLSIDGRPLGGAALALTTDPDDGRVPLASAKSTAVGTFRMERVPTGRYRLRARVTGYVEGGEHVDVSLPETKAVDLKLTPTTVLAGQIQDSRGTPIPLARVLAFPVGGGGAPGIYETQGDDRGRFKLTGLAPGAHRLLIEAPGLGTASGGPVTAPDETVVVALPGTIRAIMGRVARAGQAGKNARVLLGGESVPEPRSTMVDSQGRFVFAGLGPGSYVLRAEAGGLVSPVLTEVVSDHGPSQVQAIELALGPGAFTRGRVVAEDGQAVAGAAVQIDLVPTTGLWPPVFTGSDGSWTSAPLSAGTYRVRARHPGMVARRAVTVEISRGSPSDVATLPPVTLELVRAGKISGRVVDEQGAPQAGATVHDRLAETEELGVIWSRLPLAAEAAALPSGAVIPNAVMEVTGTRRAITDGAGRFFLSDVPPGRVRVEVLNPSSIPLRTAPVALAPGATLDLGTLRLKAANQIAGRVLDVDGRPMGGVRVVAASVASPSDTGSGLYAITAGDGAFALPLGAGEHRLTASASGRIDVVTTIQVPTTGGALQPVTLRFSKGGDLAFYGVIRDRERRPLARARIAARAIGSAAATTNENPRPPGSHAVETRPLATAVADAGGAFRLTGLPAGPFRLEISHDAYAPYARIIESATASPSGSPVSIDVPVPGGIDGEVHERVTGGPVPGFQIEARGPDGATARFPAVAARKRTAEPLRFAFRRLTPGRWTLRVRAPGYQTLERTVEVPSAATLGDASLRDLRLELERA